MTPRLHGEELQRRFDEIERDCRQTPSYLCMLCKKPSEEPFAVFNAVFGDLGREKETGTLEVQGRIRLRICKRCYATMLAEHARAGTPARLA